MAKQRTAHAYELELRRMIKERTKAEMEVWLYPQVRATAMNMVMLDKIQDELSSDKGKLVDYATGSMGQKKLEANPLLPHYDKLQRTLLMQFEALGLNYATTPSKVKEDVKKGVDTEKDAFANMLQSAKDNTTEIPDNM